MNIFKTKTELSSFLTELRKKNKTIGFVPTMGALHDGHISLTKQSASQTDYTVVSIFVNPTQFNDPKDLEKYPRTIDKDIEKLKQAGVSIVFLPNVTEIYPKKDSRIFDFGNIDKVMEGKHRQGHFNGVAQVVSILFEIVIPNKAFFGLKDFQQYVIVKELVKKYMADSNIEIIGCKIIREPNGLAMSSRNELLSSQERENASIINSTLQKAKTLTGEKSVDEIKNFVIQKINQNKFLKVEYFDIVDDTKLEQIKTWEEKSQKVGCIAVFCGSVRLIDNIYF
ncbi:MAG: pantoate--beta-alanine ligase [Bacteroidales bacterium]|nr:pantoate--beta-alanine ligase [Bacteroidales bacterium]